MNNLKLLVSLFSFLLIVQGAFAALTATPSTPAATNTVIDVGQNTVINTLITGGFTSYTYNWFWVAPGGATGLANGNTIPILISNTVPSNVQIIVSPISITTLKLFIPNSIVTGASATNTLVTTGSLSGSWAFNVFVCDGVGATCPAGTNTVAGGNTPVRSITINPAFSLSANTISNVVADQGQTETFTIGVTGGTSP